MFISWQFFARPVSCLQGLVFTIQLIFFAVFRLTGQSLISSESAGMAGVDVFQQGLWSVVSNQAGLAFSHNPSAGFHYENRYFFSQTAIKAIAAAIPAGKIMLGSCFSAYGYSLYHEGRSSLSAARMLGKHYAAGIGLNHHYVRSARNDYRVSNFTAEAGLIARPLTHLQVAVHVANPWISRSEMQIMPFVSPVFSMGIGYTEEKTFLGLELESDANGTLRLMTGVNQLLAGHYLVRAGAAPLSSEYGFGIGFVTQRMHCDIAFLTHLRLGFCPYLTFIYDLGKI